MIVFLKAASNGESNEQINHIYYAEQHTNKHSLAHTIMTVTELLRNDNRMKLFYRYHRPFKQLVIKLYKKYGAKSQYTRTDPGISYALNHLMRVLYIRNMQKPGSQQGGNTPTATMHSAFKANRQQSAQQLNINTEFDSKSPRICSNSDCKNEETKVGLSIRSDLDNFNFLPKVFYCSKQKVIILKRLRK